MQPRPPGANLTYTLFPYTTLFRSAGEKREWVARVIPSVAYTDPEIAWVGVTETEAKEKGLKVGVGKFPWAASGRAIGLGRTEGFTKLVFDEATQRMVGAGIRGVPAGDLIAEPALAQSGNPSCREGVGQCVWLQGVPQA